MQKESWPKPFKYRWYQKDLLTDKSKNIILTAGRAVGKCNPMFSRIYTNKGYTSIAAIIKSGDPYFVVYALNNENKLVQRRATFEKNGMAKVLRVETESGFTFDGTVNHPILTPNGYIRTDQLSVGDEVAIASSLPWEGSAKALNWFELRWFGYASGASVKINPEMYFNLAYQKQVAEFQAIAKYFDCTLIQDSYGFKLSVKRGFFKHYVNILLKEMKCRYSTRQPLLRVPDIVRMEALSNIKVYLESFFSLWGTVERKDGQYTVSVSHPRKTFLQDIQELLLRFSVETIITHKNDVYELKLRDEKSVYRFFQKLTIPGVDSSFLPMPFNYEDEDDIEYRFDKIVNIIDKGSQPTFAISVKDDHNYICDGLIVHNSLVLEDKIMYESINYDIIFPETKEQAVSTANENQLMPLWDRLDHRFNNSKLYSEYIRGGGLNRSKKTLTIPVPNGDPYKITSRIAGNKGENSVVGLHVARIKVDEIQLYPWSTWTQLMPTLNAWEENTQVFCCGVKLIGSPFLQ